MNRHAIELVHVVAAIVMVGTTFTNGLLRMHADRTGDLRLVAYASRVIVRFDLTLMLPAILALPITGVALARTLGFPLDRGWIAYALGATGMLLGLFAVGTWLEIRLLRIVEAAVAEGATKVPDAYHRIGRIALPVGFAATAVIFGVLYLMVYKYEA